MQYIARTCLPNASYEKQNMLLVWLQSDKKLKYIVLVYESELEDDLVGETSGYFQRMMRSILTGFRQVEECDDDFAAEQAQKLVDVSKFWFYPHVIARGKQQSHGVQRRMVLVDIFLEFFKLFFLLCCWYMRPSVRCGGYTWPVLTATSIWKSFLKYEWCPWNCILQFHGHHSYFRKDFQMLVAAKEGEI